MAPASAEDLLVPWKVMQQRGAFCPGKPASRWSASLHYFSEAQ